MKYRLIGDIHGDYKTYLKLIQDADKSIQVGDFGVGFGMRGSTARSHPSGGDLYARWGPLYEETLKAEPNLNHRFIRGNHDNPEACRENKLWIPDGTMCGPFFCVGGGLSIDKSRRTPGWDYWTDEELSYADFYEIADSYEALKPDFVISHDAPESVIQIMFHDYYSKNLYPSITRQGLDMLRNIHKPKYHFFGHWHEDRVETIEGTTYVCLGINSVFDIEIPDA